MTDYDDIQTSESAADVVEKLKAGGGGYFYRGVVWTKADPTPIVDALRADPDEIPQFIDITMKNIRGVLAWNGYATASEWFENMMLVLRLVDPDPRNEK